MVEGTGFVYDEFGDIHLPEDDYVQAGQYTYCTVREKCKHTLGIDYRARTYRRWGKTYCRTYRNAYGAFTACFDPLIERGLMRAAPSEREPEKGNYWFHFTEAGLAWMAKELGYEKIKLRDKGIEA